jgi:hypothetical protein
MIGDTGVKGELRFHAGAWEGVKPTLYFGVYLMKTQFIVIVLALGFLAGCEESSSDKTPPNASTPPANTAVQAPAAPAAPSAPQGPAPAENATPSVPAAASTTTTTNTTEAPADVPPGMEQVKAEAGMGAKGKDYGEGIIVTPVSTYFQIRERIFYDMLLKAMNEFKAFEGRVPKDEKEFDEKIIKAYGIKLPTLHPGESYRYDPKVGELMIVRPKT